MAETPKQPKDQPKADRPSWLPEEFNTPEQLVAKYQEFKKRLRLYVAEPRKSTDLGNGTVRTDY